MSLDMFSCFFVLYCVVSHFWKWKTENGEKCFFSIITGFSSRKHSTFPFDSVGMGHCSVKMGHVIVCLGVVSVWMGCNLVNMSLQNKRRMKNYGWKNDKNEEMRQKKCLKEKKRKWHERKTIGGILLYFFLI